MTPRELVTHLQDLANAVDDSSAPSARWSRTRRGSSGRWPNGVATRRIRPVSSACAPRSARTWRALHEVSNQHTGVSMMQYRQGDVLLVSVTEIPAEAKPLAPENGLVILARGEATGHHHSIRSGATLFRPDDMPSGGPGGFLVVEAGGALLEHQEHDAIRLPPGLYFLPAQVEESPEAVRLVED